MSTMLGVLAFAPVAASAARQGPTATSPAPTSPVLSEAPPDCQPFGGLTVTDVVRAIRSGGGTEVTQYLKGGAYIVSRCDVAGRLERQQHVLRLPSARGKLRVLAEDIRRGRAGLRWSAALLLVDGGGRLVLDPHRAGQGPDPLPPTRRRALADPMAAMRAALAKDRGCSEDEYADKPLAVAGGRYSYEARIDSMPHGHDDRVRITKGHHTWNETENPCGIDDATDVSASYDGETGRTVHTYADGHNVVDFGDPGVLGCSASGGAIVVACTQVISSNGRTASDIDQRYTDLHGRGFFSDGSPSSHEVDLWSAAAHESGHALGLGHSEGSESLTMYPTTVMGTTHMRDLGRGDADGLRCQYSGDDRDC